MQDPITVRTTKVETYLRVSSASNVGKCLLIRLNYMVAHSLQQTHKELLLEAAGCLGVVEGKRVCDDRLRQDLHATTFCVVLCKGHNLNGEVPHPGAISSEISQSEVCRSPKASLHYASL